MFDSLCDANVLFYLSSDEVAEEAFDGEVWYECWDESGHMYYYNESTGESKWEAPEWVEEVDSASGAKCDSVSSLSDVISIIVTKNLDESILLLKRIRITFFVVVLHSN